MAKRVARKAAAKKQAKRQLPDGWSWFSSGAIKGCGLLRERQWIYVWDDANTIYLLDLASELIAQRRAPKEVVAMHGSDAGDALVAVSRTGQIWWLDLELNPKVEVSATFDPLAVAVDPHGFHVVVSGHVGDNIICNSAGKKVGHFETTRPLRFLAFVPNTGQVIGCAEHGLLGCYDYLGECLWSVSLGSNVGDMAVDGDGATIALAGFSHGLMRYNGGGNREGVYRIEHSPCLVAMDFEGSHMLVGSLERRLTDLRADGTIHGDKALPDRPVGLCLDVLARYGIVAFPNGELQFFTLPEVFSGGAKPGSAAPRPKMATTEPTPRWEVKAAYNVDEVASTLLEPLPRSERIAIYSNRKLLRVYDEHGELCHESEALNGIGPVLHSSDSWLAAATDRNVLGYDTAKNESLLFGEALYEISHLEPHSTFGDVLVVESCQFVSRLILPDQIAWKKEMEASVDSVAITADGSSVIALDDKSVQILDAGGKLAGKHRSKHREPLLVVGMPSGWASVARQARVLSGHDSNGMLLWSVNIPWIPWGVRRVGTFVLITSPDGSSMLVDGNGEVVGKNTEPRENARYFVFADGSVGRVFPNGQTLVVTTFDGKLVWRYTDDNPFGPFTASAAGVWVFLGRLLTFFPFQ